MDHIFEGRKNVRLFRDPPSVTDLNIKQCVSLFSETVRFTKQCVSLFSQTVRFTVAFQHFSENGNSDVDC